MEIFNKDIEILGDDEGYIILICPYCKSENVNYTLKIVDEKSKMGYGAIWCNDCKKAFHISRIKVDEEIIKEIPSDLEFD